MSCNRTDGSRMFPPCPSGSWLHLPAGCAGVAGVSMAMLMGVQLYHPRILGSPAKPFFTAPRNQDCFRGLWEGEDGVPLEPRESEQLWDHGKKSQDGLC